MTVRFDFPTYTRLLVIKKQAETSPRILKFLMLLKYIEYTVDRR